jgi:hypothetical protein
MTEGFRLSPQSPTEPGYAGAAAARQDAVDTVQRIMGEDIAPAQRPATPPTAVQDGPSSDGADASATEVAKQQAAEVADTAKQAGAQVADTVKEQAGQVTAEATHQARQLLAQAQSELSEQAAAKPCTSDLTWPSGFGCGLRLLRRIGSPGSSPTM